jgi:hypothetical protein
MSRLWILLLGLGVIAGYGSAWHEFHGGYGNWSSWSCHHDNK